MNKRGISAIVATVLIILITVAGVSIIWVAILPMISESLEFSALEGRVSVVSGGGYTVYDAEREVAIVQVKREVDEGVMNRVKISFIIDGNSVSSNVVAPDSGAVKTYSFDLSGYGEPESVGVAPIFVSGSGSEKEGSVSSVKMAKRVVNLVDADVYEMERDYFYEIPMTGLVSWWKFDGDATDSVGGNDGDLLRGASIFDDNELLLDGTNDYVDLGGDSSLDFAGGVFSIGVWVKFLGPNAANHHQYILSSSTDASAYSGYNFWITNTGQLRCRISDGTSQIILSSVVDMNDYFNEWSYLNCIYSGGNMYLYVNGVLDKSRTNSVILGSNLYTPKIGMLRLNYYFFNGYMDDMMIYDRALSEEEVAAIYDIQKRVEL